MTNQNNPQGLAPGDIIKPVGPHWSKAVAAGEWPITHIDELGHPRFAAADLDDWVADESPGWAVEVVSRAASPEHDPVNHPSHYKTASGLEAIDVMEAFNLHRDGRLFNAGKYILRAGQKDKESQDIRKAIWYLERYAADLEEANK